MDPLKGVWSKRESRSTLPCAVDQPPGSSVWLESEVGSVGPSRGLGSLRPP